MSGRHNLITNVDKECYEIDSNKEAIREVAEKYLETLLAQITIGIMFVVDRHEKANVLDIEEVLVPKEEYARPCVDIFGSYNFKKKYECLCRNCGRIVGASVFAPHLEVCMGMGRSRSRNASRRIASNSRERENTSYGSTPSDDEDDIDWNSGEKRKKKKDRNGNRKLRGTPKKGNELDPADSINIDVEGEVDEVLSLRDLLQDFSRGQSSAGSISPSSFTKRRDKIKSKKYEERESIPITEDPRPLKCATCEKRVQQNRSTK